MRTGAVVLCAGGGSRYRSADGAHKLQSAFRGRPLASWAVSHALEAGMDETMVVTGAVDLSNLLPAGVIIVENPQWREGIATSLARGIDKADELGLDAVVVGLGDQPLVPAAAWKAVAASRSEIAVATYWGDRRNPVRLARSVWGELPRTGDAGARALMRARPELVQEVPCDGDPRDFDTVDDTEPAR